MKLKGSYTVEAAIVISFCFILFAMAVGLAYELFKSSLDYVAERDAVFNAVEIFRAKETVLKIIDAIKD